MKKDDILKAAHQRMDEAVEYEATSRDAAQEDLAFVVGDGQWPEAERTARNEAQRPCLTFNQMPQFLRRVTAQLRGMNPAIKVTAADNRASTETAEIIEGLIRHIEYDSDATSIYEGTAEAAAAGSFAHFRVRNVFEDGLTFDQKIIVERIHNPFAVFTDPNARHPTRIDAQWRFIVDEVPLEQFKLDYPDASTEPFTDEHKPSWYLNWSAPERNAVSVAEYYWIEMEAVEIGMTADGQVIQNWPKGFKPVRVRKAMVPRVKWAKLTGCEVLEGPIDVPGQLIPVITITGEEIHVGDHSYLSSVTRYAKDAQVAYNLAQTTNVEVILSQPKAPYMVTAEQVAGFEGYWNKANTSNSPYLPYNSDPNAPPPMRVPPPVASQGLMAMAQMAAEDMKRTTGIYDASLGARSNETSGIAIEARQKEAEAANSVYADNMVKAVHQCGRVIIGMIPEIYDTARVIRILGEDANEKLVDVNQIVIQDGVAQPVNDLRVGSYDVRISVGPAYNTRREEAAAALVELSRSIPAIGQVAPDLVVRSMDFPDAERLAERLAKGLPPGMQEDPEEPTPEQMQQMQQAKMQQAQMMQMQQAAAMAKIKGEIADANKAEADAARAMAEANKARIEAEILGYQLAAAKGQAHVAATNAAMMNGSMAQAIDAGVQRAILPQT